MPDLKGLRPGFSLIEVVLAVAVFATAILSLAGVAGAILGRMNSSGLHADVADDLPLVESWLRSEMQRDPATFVATLDNDGYALFTWESLQGVEVSEAAEWSANWASSPSTGAVYRWTVTPTPGESAPDLADALEPADAVSRALYLSVVVRARGVTRPDPAMTSMELETQFDQQSDLLVVPLVLTAYR